MDNNFEPKSVEATSVTAWFRNGLELASRNIAWHLGLILLFAAIHYLPGLSEFMLYIVPVLFGLSCLVADSSDKHIPFIQNLRSKPRAVWLRLALFSIAPWLGLKAFNFALLILLGPTDGQPVMEEIEGELITDFEGGMVTLLYVLLWFLFFGYLLWFSVPLLTIAELPLLTTIIQSIKALELNSFVFWLIWFLSISSLFASIMPVLVFPWISIVASAMYVSYKHIWLSGPAISSTKSLAVAAPKSVSKVATTQKTT